jgi:putative drug exporter of the RND superfamily
MRSRCLAAVPLSGFPACPPPVPIPASSASPAGAPGTVGRRSSAGCWLLTAAGAVGTSVGTREIDRFRLPGTESQRAYDLLAEHSPKQNGITDQLVYVARDGTLKDSKLQTRIERTLDRVRKVPIVVDVSKPQLAPDGKIAIVSVVYVDDIDEIDPDDLQVVQDAAFSARGADLQVEHGGEGAQFLRSYEGGSPTELIGLLAAFIVLLITFGSLIAAGVPLLTAVLPLGATLGLVPVISQVVDAPDFAPQLAALIGIGVGIDYALIVLTRYGAEHERLVARSEPVDDSADDAPQQRRAMRQEALLVAMDTAGRTVYFAGLTVMIALLGLLLLGLSFMQGAAIAAALAVLLTMLAALTLLPALLSRAGSWIDRLRLPLPGGKRRSAAAAARAPGESPVWVRWSEFVQRRPWPALLVALAILLGLAVPALHMRLGSSDAGLDPPDTTTRKAYDIVADGFGAGTNGSFLLAVQLARKGDTAAAARVADAVSGDPGVARVSPPQLAQDGEAATIVLFPTSGPQEEKTATLLDRLREDRLPAVEQATGTQVYVGGPVASEEDFTSVIADKLPLFVGMVVLLSALLLTAVFRSVFIPIKAAAMNLLSIGAALGFVTIVFQDGLGADTLGVGAGPVESFVPVMLFAIVFGLSMDYEVFLVSRIHEEWLRTRDAARAVRIGVATTGRVITAAASIMIVVFATFALLDDIRIIKELGLGLAMAVLLDALIIRCLLVPALMQIVGASAWWFPSWLDRRLPRVALEPE